MSIAHNIKNLQGPILVLGGSGFIGANLMQTLLRHRDDVYGTTSNFDAWRLEGVPERNKVIVDLLVEADLENILDEIAPRTVFNCVSYGGYSFEADVRLIYLTNFTLTTRLLHLLEKRSIACYIHSGSSSEYGDNCSAPVKRL